MTSLPAAASVDTWRRASAAARALRTHAARITVVEERGSGSNDASGPDLLLSRLREGVSAYERLTDTAAELVAKPGDSPVSGDASLRLADATDALVGMIRGLVS